MSDSEGSEVDQFEQFREHCQKQDISGIPREMRAYDTQEEAEQASNAMDDECWQSQAVIDRDMLEQPEERVNWINFADDFSYSERILKAVEKGCTKLVEELIEGESDLVHVTDQDGYTPLHRASYQGWVDITEILLAAGASVSARTEDGWTPLHSAARWNKAEVAERLICFGADVNALTNGQQTPLHIASTSQASASIMHLLLWHPDTDVTLLNNCGETAEKLARGSTAMGPLYEIRHPHVDYNGIVAM